MPTKLKPTPKLKAAKIKLKELVKAARAAGVHVEVGLSPHASAMPLRYPSDPPYVLALIEESERLNVLGNRWVHAPKPNPLAAEACFRSGWAFALVAAWLRCQLHGKDAGMLPTDSKWVTLIKFDWEKEKTKAKKK
jgi:hypothetical protein